jgi:CelD/BcsL family acetyltransferase involved in cellulose biosynthesis
MPPVTAAIEPLSWLSEHAAAWDALAASARAPAAFMLSDWLLPHAALGGDAAIVVAWSGTELVGGLPLLLDRRGPLRLARLLCGPEPGPVAPPIAGDCDAEAVAGALVSAVRGLHADALWVEWLPASSPLAHALPPRARRLRARVPTLEMPSGFAAAFGGRAPGRRQAARLAKAGAVEYEVARDPAHVAALVDDVFRLHELRWAARLDFSTLDTPAGRAFHRDALVRLAADDHVRLVLLRLDGQAIAFDVVLVVGDTAHAYRTAFDPAYARYSPGLLVVSRAGEVVSADGVRTIVWGPGDTLEKLVMASRVDDAVSLLHPLRPGTGSLWVAARRARERTAPVLARSATVRRVYSAARRLRRAA